MDEIKIFYAFLLHKLGIHALCFYFSPSLAIRDLFHISTKPFFRF